MQVKKCSCPNSFGQTVFMAVDPDTWEFSWGAKSEADARAGLIACKARIAKIEQPEPRRIMYDVPEFDYDEPYNDFID